MRDQILAAKPRFRAWKAVPSILATNSETDVVSEMASGVTGVWRCLFTTGAPGGRDKNLKSLYVSDLFFHIYAAEVIQTPLDDVTPELVCP
jgi:hypothetical protein